ncbi:BCN_G0044480.mRNA.1.CDS.1 [Saccharomyces cerevisiae]|nr:BCN_G0044480.mRNA.1.CDS.1 [Saccharomyces cerevisiae]CAI4729188.1 BCE_3a_G0044490.mRNA.1.CDS.1 [Saccharomyces cerevisiae]CAI5304345.1 ALI_HP2_G0043880.mRNA.1.CDS.1 [Saccharomyces cerevisiae]CAI6651158.1 ALI_HP2_G0043880.mRNA.1.CDS.1 [Saccharomyces cerevisiae]CAI6731267.1 ALI_HP1_G0044580.mRNA.1.CDS.1 [Saccharomyces cerevisiae]
MSALLSESDLNDFISPALACVKPTQVSGGKKDNVNMNGEYEVSTEPDQLEKVSITLSDCLACSGCITSSEEILLSSQSHSVFLKNWGKLSQQQDKFLVVSVSPQCRLSLAQYYGLTLEAADLCLMNFFQKHFQCKYMVGTEMGRIISISKTVEKIIAHKKQKGNTGVDRKPLLSAVCPGFLIYTEKTKPQLVPMLLNVKSPQQITGSLIRATFESLAIARESFYHLSLMPCFDKKLEASRPESLDDGIDCVITPREIVTMLQELNLDFKSFLTEDTSLYGRLSPPGWDPRVHWASNLGGTCGGYAYQYVTAVQRLHPGSQMIVLEGRNSDIVEYRLLHDDRIIAAASELSGFRNIQNLVRKLTSGSGSERKRNITALRKRRTGPKANSREMAAATAATADPYHSDYIEVNACPGACMNGNGLLNGEQNSLKRKQLVQTLNKRHGEELAMVDPLTLGPKLEEAAARPLSLEYVFAPVKQAVEKDLVSVGSTW